MNSQPLPRSIYAFTKYRLGEFLLFLDKKENYLLFMQLPDRYEFNLTCQDFDKALQNNILDYIEQIPEDVFEVCLLNLKKS